VSRDMTEHDAAAVHAAAELARWSAYAMTALLLVGAVTVGYRRLADAIQHPLDWPSLLAIGAAAAGTAAAIRWLLRWPAPTGEASAAARLLPWIISLGLAGWGGALSLGGTRYGGLALLWGLLIGEEIWAGRVALKSRRRLGNLNDGDHPPDTADDLPESSTAHIPDLRSGLAAPPPENAFQEFVRSRQPDGGEMLTGWMRIALTPGQRSTAVHLAFCPPFARAPSVRVLQREGPTARIKEAQVLPFGARLDVKLSEAAGMDAVILLEVVVTDPPASPVKPVRL
jgi:hypothetical protein